MKKTSKPKKCTRYKRVCPQVPIFLLMQLNVTVQLAETIWVLSFTTLFSEHELREVAKYYINCY